jgi:uncharacterized protein YhbP (UPF0306 family)
MYDQKLRDENLLVVAAVEGYSLKHGIPAKETLAIFDQKNLIDIIRSNYETLHTQGLSESAAFAEDVLTQSRR